MVTNDKNIQAGNGFGRIEKVDVFGSFLLRRKHLAGIKLKVSRGFFLAHFNVFFYGSNIVDCSGEKMCFSVFLKIPAAF